MTDQDDALMAETEEWLAVMREAREMSDEDFYAAVRPEFDSTDNMKAILEESGREGIVRRLFGRRYKARHALP